MSLTEKPSIAQQEDFNSHPLAWGVEQIGKVIGRTPRQTFHILSRGQLKSAKKVGGRWVANRNALLRELSGDAA
jgi:hypothetical protein